HMSLYLLITYPPHHDPPPFPTRRSSDLRGRHVPLASRRLFALSAARRCHRSPDLTRRRHHYGFRRVYGVPGRAAARARFHGDDRSEEHTSELQSRFDLVCRLLLEKKKKI